MVASFIFGGNTGETPDSLKRRRQVALALMQQDSTPKNVGEGLAAVGRALSGRFALNYLDKKEGEKTAKSNSAFDALINGGGSTPSTVPMSGAGNEVSASTPPSGPVTAKGEIADYIRQAATARGIDPDTALRVAMSEGGLENPVNQSSVVKNGVREQSYGPFQLYMGGGLGNKALEAGIDPRDPNQWQKGVDFALDQAKQGGWGPWYGAKKIGVTGMAGIGNAPQQVASASPMTATDAIATQSPQVPPVAPQQAYVDPQVANVGPQQPMPNAAAALAAPQGQQQAMAPQLPPPQNVSAPPPVAAVPQQAPQQVAQNTPAQALSRGPSIQQLAQLANDPYLDEGKRGAVQALLQQKMLEQKATFENQLKQQDPGYQTDLQLKQAQLRDLTNPTIKPADQARIDIERQKADFEQNGMSFADKEKLKLEKEKADAEKSKPTVVNGRLVRPDGTVIYEGKMTDEQEQRLKFDREKFDVEQKKGQWQKLTDGRLYNETTGEFRDAPPPVPGSATLKPDDVSGIRKEIQQLPSYKNLSQATPIYKSMVETADRNSKASDLNLVYGLGKIMDPTSVVREGEMVMVKNTASLPDWLVGAANALNGGATLQPETRQAILREAYGRMKGYSDEFGQQMGQYRGISQRYNLNEDDIIPKFAEFKEWAPEPSADQKTQQIDDLLKKYGTQ